MTETNTDKILKGLREWWLREGHSSRSADSTQNKANYM